MSDTNEKKMGDASSDAVNYAQLVAELAPIALELALKLTAIVQNANSSTSTAPLTSEALTADADVVNKVNAWLSANGLPTT